MALSSFGILPFPVILLIIGFPLGTILSIIGAKRPWGLKKTIEFIVAVLVSLVLILARSSLSGGTGDKYVQMVKNGTLEAYPQMEVGKAFDSYLKNPKWESGLSEDNTRFVNVTGKILYYDKEVEIVVQFIVNEKDETFQYNACEINDVPQSDFIYWGLLENIYNSDSTSSGLDSPSDYNLSSVSNTVSETSTSAYDDDASIRNAYIQKVQELAAENSDLKFGLIDLTANNVYELVADMPGYYVNVYVYDNGSVIPIMEEWGYGAGGSI